MNLTSFLRCFSVYSTSVFAFCLVAQITEQRPASREPLNRSLFLSSSASQEGRWRQICEEATDSGDPRWSELGTAYDLGNGVIGVVSQGVFDPESLAKRAEVLTGLAKEILQTNQPLPLSSLEGTIRDSIVELVSSYGTPEAIAAVRKADTEIGLGLSVRYELELPGGVALTVDAGREGPKPRATKVAKSDLKDVAPTNRPPLLHTPWSWREHAYLHFYRAGDLAEQFRLASRLFDMLEPVARDAGRNVLSGLSALNDALRTTIAIDIRGSNAAVRTEQLSQDAKTLLLDQLLELERAGHLGGFSGREAFASATVRSIRVRPTLIVVSEVQAVRHEFAWELSPY